MFVILRSNQKKLQRFHCVVPSDRLLTHYFLFQLPASSLWVPPRGTVSPLLARGHLTQTVWQQRSLRIVVLLRHRFRKNGWNMRFITVTNLISSWFCRLGPRSSCALYFAAPGLMLLLFSTDQAKRNHEDVSGHVSFSVRFEDESSLNVIRWLCTEWLHYIARSICSAALTHIWTYFFLIHRVR